MSASANGLGRQWSGLQNSQRLAFEKVSCLFVLMGKTTAVDVQADQCVGILRFRTSFHSHHCSDQAIDCTLSSRSATNSKPPESRLRSRSCFLNMGCRLSASCSISMQCPRHMAFNKYSLCEYREFPTSKNQRDRVSKYVQAVVLDLLSPHQHLDGCGASHLDRGHRKSASYKW